jgi:tRNA uridine 5-carbamoylmethylation protein Kti12
MLRDQPRIVVVGTSCSGKTTFSRRLAQSLGREHVELDALHWGPNCNDNRESLRTAFLSFEYRALLDEPRYSHLIVFGPRSPASARALLSEPA